MRSHSLTVVACGLLVAGAAAQTPAYHWVPVGADKLLGGSNNTIPIWSTSATYQQVHDSRDMARLGKVVLMKGMVFRPGSNYVIAARKMDCVVNLSHTAVAPLKATTTFATNLGKSPTMVVGGKDGQGKTTYTTISWSANAKVSGVNAPLIIFSFVKPFVYVPTSGHLCWEWRLKNNTSNANGFLDAAANSASTNRGTPSFSGNACTSNGKTSSARFNLTSTSSRWRYDVNASLTNAPANAKALMAVGAVKQNANLGWCTNLQVLPFLIIFGQASSGGAWNTKVPMDAVVGLPPFQLHVQYAYDDKTKKAGFGLSNLASYTLPRMTGVFGMTRVWKATSRGSSNGDETATTGSIQYGYGLVTGFRK